MMGRGTRRCDEIGKTRFTVFDAVGVMDYFSHATAFTTDPPDKPARSIVEVIEAIYGNVDRAYNIRILVHRLQRIAKDVSAEGREMFKRYIPNGDISAFARDLPDALDRDWAGMMALLRNPDFQKLLRDYPRAKRTFIIAESPQDTVVSGILIHTADGRAVRPDDYLIAFQAFIRDNPEHVQAIEILLKRPTEWDTAALRELRQKLGDQPEGFNEERLRKAYQHELADLISIVKHAAQGEPLLSADERVDRALSRLRAGREFTPQQERWLELIRNHLAENLAIDRQDFDLITFTHAGATWGRVDRDFNGGLSEVLAAVNHEMAS
jgi:type I restriction enzyme R subunit